MAPGADSVADWSNKYGKSNMGRLQNFYDAQRANSEKNFREGGLANMNSAFANSGGVGGSAHALASGRAWGDYQSNMDAQQAQHMWQAADAETARDYGGYMQDRGLPA